ncbi:MAG: hypothetical protein ABJE95_04700 [Byssovorax sp.]
MNHPLSTITPLLLSAFFAATLAACGGSGGTASTGAGGGSTTTGNGGSMTTTTTAGSGGAGSELAKFCDDIDAPYCEALFACCTDQAKLDLAGGTVSGCKTKFATSCATDFGASFSPHLQNGDTVLNAAALAACVSSLTAMKGGGAACTRPPTFVLELDCVAALKGTIAPGAACDSTTLHDTEYVICDKGNCDQGKCKAFLATGATCDPTMDDTYAAGCNFPAQEHCVASGAMGKCGPIGSIGDACTPPDHDKTFSCYSMSCGPAGQCIDPTADGICAGG